MTHIRFSRWPAAVVYAKSTWDVVRAVKCGYTWDVPLTVANGRHSYQGLSIIDGYLTIDTSNLTKLEVVTEPSLSAMVGPGVTNALFVSWLHGNASKDVFPVIGDCPSLAFGGFSLGGGMSLASRTHGLGCDSVFGLTMVMYDGTVITANATHHADLLWAACGGGGGLGVVTEFAVQLHRLPSKTYTYFSIRNETAHKTENLEGKIDFQMTLQKWWASPDRRLAGGAAGPDYGAEGIFWGTAQEAQAAMYDAGLLESPDQNVTDCAYCGEFDSYYDKFLIETCAYWVGSFSGDKVGQLFPGRSKTDCHDHDFLYGDFASMAASPGSPITRGASSLWQTWNMYTCRLLDPPSRQVWQALAGKPATACDAVKENAMLYRKQVADGDLEASRCYAVEQGLLPSGAVDHILGGAVAERSPEATAYYHRGKYSPICVDAKIYSEWVGSNGQLLKTATDSNTNWTVQPQAIASAIAKEITDRLDGVYGELGREQASASYINYQNGKMVNWQTAYFGNNVERLASIKERYDPLGMFSKPLIVDGKSSSQSSWARRLSNEVKPLNLI
jgi:FAD/FMN-containing dehydrogenase